MMRFHFDGNFNTVEGSRFFADRMPYETGAILCLLMDELEVPDWQGVLNHQTKGTQGGFLSNVYNTIPSD